MKLARFLILLAALAVPTTFAADAPDDITARALADYAQRLETATKDLNDARQQILRERQPLADAERKAEDRVSALQAEISELDAAASQKNEKRQQLNREMANLHRNLSYLGTLAEDGLKTFNDGLLPGESDSVGDRIQSLQEQLDAENRTNATTAAMGAIDFMSNRIERQLGGYAIAGSAVDADDNRLLKGTFAFVGPDAFFKPDNAPGGTLRPRAGSPYAVMYSLPDWSPADASRAVGGDVGTILADASGGKALRLQQINGTLWQHVQRGGVVAYIILAVGLLALAIGIQKVVDLRRFALGSAASIATALAAVRGGSRSEMETSIAALNRSTRDLFTAGLRHLNAPKSILEEHLYAHMLQIRLQAERRLPLLAVIATAAPLMGLLGTVIGMVKTFALITVFGTGNAAKLSAGISEILITTELGLVVAVPALVAHGFLAHRIQKNLSTLDRYAVEFVTAAEEAKLGAPAAGLVSA